MKHTGTGIEGPGSDLWFVDGDDSERVAVAYLPQYQDDPVLAEGLDPFRSFLSETGIDGLLNLESSPQPGVFVYDLRGGLTLAEVLDAHRQLGRPCGALAAAEFLQQAAEVLADAADAGVEFGLPNHGDITPWRLVVDAEGYVDVLGHGLLNLSVAEFLAERADSVPADAIRYAPPERLELRAEDVHADLYSIALIAAEMITGQPVLPGSAEDIVEPLLAGEVSARIERACSDVADSMLDVLCIATELNVADRFKDADEFIAAAKAAKADATGPTLLDVLSAAFDVQVRIPLGPQPVEDAVDEPATDEVEAPESASTEPQEEPEPTAHVATPEPVPVVEPEPEIPEERDEFAPPPALPPLPADVDLAAVRARAAAVVARVGAIAERVRQVAEAGNAEAEGGDDDVAATARRLADAVAKAERSHKSAQRSAGLVELDDEPDEAKVTLGLVTGAEQQVANALEAARDGLADIRAAMAEAHAEQARIDALADEVQDLTDACSQRVGQASEALQALLERVSTEELSAAGVTEAVSRAKGAMDRARAASNKAIESIDEVAGCNTAEDAEAFTDTARSALTTVQEALEDVLESVDVAISAEAAGLEESRSDVQAQAEAASAAHERAIASLSRARSAVEMGPSPQATQLLAQAEAELKSAKQADHDAGVEARTVAGATRSVDAREALAPAQNAARVAQAASDRIESLCQRASDLAGEAAEAAALLIAARKTTDAILHKAREQVASTRTTIDALLADTDEVKGGSARVLIDDATAAMAGAESALEDLEGHHAMAEKLDDPEQVEAVVSKMRPLGTTVTTTTATAIDSSERCRHVAQDELAEIMEERARLNALNSAAEQAKAHAEKCRRAVDEAWVRYRGLPDRVTGSTIEAVSKGLKEAYELIDIAEFQAGEASAAAKDAARQGDPKEAAGYAESAASFWERISEDLPEALRHIDDAEALANDEADRLQHAHDRTAAAFDEVTQSKVTIAQHTVDGAALAQPWPDDRAIQGALTRLRKANDGLDDDITEAEYARDRAAGVNLAKDAQEMVPVAEKVLRRVQDKREGAQSALDDLKKLVQLAEQQQQAIAHLQAEVTQLAEQVLDGAKRARSAHSELTAAIAEHGANEAPVRDLDAQTLAAVQACSKAKQQVKELQRAIAQATTAEQAEGLAVTARQAAATVEAQLASATELAVAGAAAALQEAHQRTQEQERQKVEARAAAQESASKAANAVAAVTHSLDETREIVIGAPSREAQDRLAEAERLMAKLRGLAEASTTAAQTATTDADSDDVLAASMDAREATQRATATSRQALAALDQARSLALAALDQATALAAVRHQMEELANRADAAVTLAREQSSFLDEVLDDAKTDKTLALRAQADDAIANARKAATKVHTALPMVAEADSLDVAKHMLKASEKAVALATEAADRVPALVERAKQRLIEEAEEERHALEQARADAVSPLKTARAAVEKAKGWIEAGHADVAEHADVREVAEAFGDLHGSLSAVESALATAEQTAEPAATAATPEAAAAIGALVQTQADAVIAAIATVGAARTAFQAAVAEAVQNKEAMAAARSQCAEAVAALTPALEERREAFAAFEATVREAAVDEAEVADLLDRAEDFLRGATDAVHRARTAEELVQKGEDFAAVEQAAAVATERIAKAQETLAAIHKGIADGEDELKRIVLEAAEKKRQAEEAARLKEVEQQREQERKDRDAKRAARPGRGLRPAGPPRSPPREPSKPRERPVRGERPTRGERRVRGERPTRGERPAPGERPARGERPSLREPASRAERPALKQPKPRDDGAESAERSATKQRLERSAADRRLRRPSRSPDDESPASSAARPERRLRRPSRSPDDPDSPRTSRRLERPSRSRSPDSEPPGDDESGSNKSDVRNRLRERRASRMASGSVSERPVRPTAGGRPQRAGARRLTRPSTMRPDEEGGEGGAGGESGEDLLKRRVHERSTSGPRRAVEESQSGPERSVDDLMERLKSRSRRSKDGED